MIQPPLRRIRFGDFEIDTVTGELRRFGSKVPLQPQPFKVLAALLERPGDLVSRGELRTRIWPGNLHVDFEHSLNRSINKLRSVLGDDADRPKLIETLPGRGYRFIGTVNAVCDRSHCPDDVDAKAHRMPDNDAAKAPVLRTSAPRGALSPASPLYVEREVDRGVHVALRERDSVVLIKGARQTGKSSLLARAVQQARIEGLTTVVTDLQKLNDNQFADVDRLLRGLAESFDEQLSLDSDLDASWSSRRGPSMNFDRFIKRTVLPRIDTHLVWAIDEADRIFGYPYAAEIFGLMRSWHNERALDQSSPCHKLTLLIAYATEAHLFVSDLNQSPFNVGTRLSLEDFTPAEVQTLNTRRGSVVSSESLASLYEWLGGHPYLTQVALNELEHGKVDVNSLCATALSDDGPFGDHLRRVAVSVTRTESVRDAFRAVLSGTGPISSDAFFRLRSAGAVVGDTPAQARPRCRLYSAYFAEHPL